MSPRTIVFLIAVGVALVWMWYSKTIGKDRTPTLDKRAKMALAEMWRSACTTNWSEPECSCDTCGDYLSPSPERVRLFAEGWSLAEEVTKKDVHHDYQYKPNVERAQRFAAAYNGDPDCAEEIRRAISWTD